MIINLKYEDRKFFHPAPSKKMLETIGKIFDKFGWKTEIPAEKLTKEEAKELIGKGMSTTKRRKVNLWETEEDKINGELDIASSPKE